MLNIFWFTILICQQLAQCKWTCPATWTLNTDRCYKKSSCWTSITNLRTTCGAPAWLAEFSTSAELQFLQTFANGMGCSSVITTGFLDVTYTGGQWTTVLGTTLSSSFLSSFWQGTPGADTCLAFKRDATWPNILLTASCSTSIGNWKLGICKQNATWIPPTASPTAAPTQNPTATNPTAVPTQTPTTSDPTASPSQSPSIQPTASPTTRAPTVSPSNNPSASPSRAPSSNPSKTPTKFPTATAPTTMPSVNPSIQPTNTPSTNPSRVPTNNPSGTPTAGPTSPPSTAGPTATTEIPRVIAVTQIGASSSSGSAGFSLQKLGSNSLYIFVMVIGVVVICICCVVAFGFCFIHQRKKSLDHLRKEVMMSQNRGRVTSNSGVGSSSYSVPMGPVDGSAEQKKILRVRSVEDVGSDKSDSGSRESSPEVVVNVQSDWEVEGPKPPPVPPLTYKQ